MPDDTVLIIGAGLAGLSAGIFAQLNRYPSRILEHHSAAGGVAPSWQRGDYLVDGGIHFLMGYRPGGGLYELYHRLGIFPGVRVRDMACYYRFIDQASGVRVDVTPDLDRLEAELLAAAPTDAALIGRLLAGARAMRGLDLGQMGMSAPPELAGRLDRLREMWGMRRIWRYVSGPYAGPVSDYAAAARASWLRIFLENLFLPSAPVYFICMLLSMLADGQLGLLEGGSRELVGAMERRYRQLGGEITFGATAAEILVRAGAPTGAGSAGRGGASACAAGVRLEDGREFPAGAVISAADGRSTLFDLLGGRFLTDAIRRRYAGWPLYPPLMMLSYGVAREFGDEPSFTALSLDRPLATAAGPVCGPGGAPVKGIFLRIFNYGTGFAPAGKTVVQAEFDADWDFWNDLRQRDRAAYQAEKTAIAAAVLARLEALYPGIGGQVEMTDVATPYTTYRHTRNDRGSWGGWLITPSAITAAVERTLPGLDRFYMAGQWAMPGGGVPGALYSGRHAVQLLCRRDGRAFTGGDAA